MYAVFIMNNFIESRTVSITKQREKRLDQCKTDHLSERHRKLEKFVKLTLQRELRSLFVPLFSIELFHLAFRFRFPLPFSLAPFFLAVVCLCEYFLSKGMGPS